MTRTDEQVTALEAAARQDSASVLELTRDLVRIPSRGGIDPYDLVLDRMACWLDAHGLECRRLTGPGGATVAPPGPARRRHSRPWLSSQEAMQPSTGS